MIDIAKGCVLLQSTERERKREREREREREKERKRETLRFPIRSCGDANGDESKISISRR